jgi:two-component system, NtrC family, sensor kinase
VTSTLDKLPTILTLGVLVGIFLALRKHSASARVRLWTYAWALIFVHFLVQVFPARGVFGQHFLDTINLGALELSGVVFLASMIRSVESRKRQTLALVGIGLPVLFHATVATFGWPLNGPMKGLVIAAIGMMAVVGGTLAFLEAGARSLFAWCMVTLAAAVSSYGVYTQLHGNTDFEVNAILTVTFGLSGVLFWRRIQRGSAGVIAVVGGFLAWGAVFPVATYLQYAFPSLTINPELWNVPKFFVAIGMVLTLLEDQSQVVEAARERERAENVFLHQLSQVSSRLLSGVDPLGLSSQIVEAVASGSSFNKAALFLIGEDHKFAFAAASGIPRNELTRVQAQAGCDSVEQYNSLFLRCERIGNQSVVLTSGDAPCEAGQNERRSWNLSVMVPLISPRGSRLGALWLGSDKDASQVSASEVVQLEILTADFAGTIENSRLHRQLVRSEKLAALGQLVAGVAHELNNPLTGILGYSELLTEEVENESTRKRIGKLGQEARRMKRIVDGLLRFARQSSAGKHSADAATALHDVIQLREYDLRKKGVALEVALQKPMPTLAIDEDELKQVLLNLLNNAMDAVEESKERSIRIFSSTQDDRVSIHFEDSGPGFAEISRALDPFYTTKPVGKGTGLGLSVCYGILRETGGDIQIANRQPYGASVVIEIPVSIASAFGVSAKSARPVAVKSGASAAVA